MSKLEQAVQNALAVAADNSIGYSQIDRYNKGRDCSSLIIDAWHRAGVLVRNHGAGYTGNMLGAFLECGFEDVTSKVNLRNGSGMKRGDVLLHVRDHAAMYIGNGQIVQARGDWDGKQGDGDGTEIRTQGYYNYPWEYVLRYTAEDNQSTTQSGTTTKVETTEEKYGVNAVVTMSAVSLPMLQFGLRGPAVKTLQTLLNSHGANLEADGIFGGQSKEAVMKFQQANNLGADGIVGSQTWLKLLIT